MLYTDDPTLKDILRRIEYLEKKIRDINVRTMPVIPPVELNTPITSPEEFLAEVTMIVTPEELIPPITASKTKPLKSEE